MICRAVGRPALMYQHPPFYITRFFLLLTKIAFRLYVSGFAIGLHTSRSIGFDPVIGDRNLTEVR